jgi:hypothetical protein
MEKKEIVNYFVKGGKPRKFGNYHVEKNRLVYRCVNEKRFKIDDKNQPAVISAVKTGALNPKYLEDKKNILAGRAGFYFDAFYLVEEVLAVRLSSGQLVGNANRLNHAVRKSFGRAVERDGEIQRTLQESMAMLPFSVFKESGLSPENIEFLDQTGPETVGVKVTRWKDGKEVTKIEKRHFTGASLFRLGKKYFLFDIDRREIEHGIFNAFLVELPGPAKTVKDAYQSLKPKEVIDAEKRGVNVKRQGEVFFLPTDKEVEPDKERNWENKIVEKRGVLQAGGNRPNYAQRINEKTGLVSGKVEHSGREHAPLILKGWFKPVPNTSTKSFQITGEID